MFIHIFLCYLFITSVTLVQDIDTNSLLPLSLLHLYYLMFEINTFIKIQNFQIILYIKVIGPFRSRWLWDIHSMDFDVLFLIWRQFWVNFGLRALPQEASKFLFMLFVACVFISVQFIKINSCFRLKILRAAARMY